MQAHKPPPPQPAAQAALMTWAALLLGMALVLVPTKEAKEAH
jgi:hypothetical protein